jgi:uncharacterized protein
VKRCYPVSKELLKFLDEQENIDLKRDFSLTYERIHSLGSARAASILAAKRGVDGELAHAAGALHDFGRMVTGKQEGHAIKGYEPVKEFLARLNIFNEREVEGIALAVKHHSGKDLVGSPLDEIAKDCDILDTFFIGIKLRTEAHYRRLASLKEELGFS